MLRIATIGGVYDVAPEPINGKLWPNQEWIPSETAAMMGWRIRNDDSIEAKGRQFATCHLRFQPKPLPRPKQRS